MQIPSIARARNPQRLPARVSGFVASAHDKWRTLLIGSGVLSSLVYVAADVACAMQFPGYSSRSQAISELSAIGSPSRSLWVLFAIVYEALLATFGVLVWREARGRRRLRVTAAMLIGIAAIGAFWPPMHLRGSVATLTDTLHVVWASVISVFIFVAIFFGRTGFGTAFRRYSIATLLALAVFGTLSFLYAPRLAANLPTPYLGFVERLNLGAYLLWVAVLAIVLGRERSYAGLLTTTLLNAEPSAGFRSRP